MIQRLLALGALMAALAFAAPAVYLSARMDTGTLRLDRELRERADALPGSSRVILRLKPGVPAAAADVAIRKVKGTSGRRLLSVSGQVAYVPNSSLAALAALPGVQRVSLDRRVYGTIERSAAAVGATWVREQLGFDGAGVGIAIVDSGVANWHDDLGSRRVVRFADFVNFQPAAYDDYGHGTHVAGIIASAGQRMPTGVAPRCRIVPVRVLGAMRRGDERVGAGLVDNINNAFKWAVDQGVDVISASLGVPHEGGGLPHEDVVRYARSRGVTIVAAAGNDGQHALYYPGALKGVIAVGAVGTDGDVAGFSTYGDQILCVAPGENIYSTYLSGDYAFSSGTSQATPFVSGAIALMKAWAREIGGATLADAQIKHVLKHTSDRLDGRFKHDRAGYGRLNVRDALRLVEHRLNRPALRTGLAA
jgi:subtilisin family serine protease